jgi:6-phospho-beta-glucosidase
VKLAVIGGGGFRAPHMLEAIASLASRGVSVDDVVFHDLAPDRLELMGRVLRALRRERGWDVDFRLSTSLEDAVEGADYVFAAIRVGGAEARATDEAIALGEDSVGQETTGPAGIAYALRTIPVMSAVAEAVAGRAAPHARLLNFTNPAGLITQALVEILGDRVIGICDGPPDLYLRVARALDADSEDLWFDYFGLNHLGWLRRVVGPAGDELPGLLADDAALGTLDEAEAFGSELLRTLGMIPMEYLVYYYRHSEVVEGLRRTGATRGSFLAEQQARFYAAETAGDDDALAVWRGAAAEREETYGMDVRSAVGGPPTRTLETGGTGGYAGVAADVVALLEGGGPGYATLNVRNRGALPFLAADDVVEVPCLVTRSGAQPVAVGDVPLHARALIETVKSVERTTVEAARTGSAALAVWALAQHPLVASYGAAERLFAAYRSAHPTLAATFGG